MLRPLLLAFHQFDVTETYDNYFIETRLCLEAAFRRFQVLWELRGASQYSSPQIGARGLLLRHCCRIDDMNGN